MPAAQRVHRYEVLTEAHDIAAKAKEYAWEMKQHAREPVAQLSQELRVEGDPASLAWVAGEVGSAREIVKNAPGEKGAGRRHRVHPRSDRRPQLRAQPRAQHRDSLAARPRAPRSAGALRAGAAVPPPPPVPPAPPASGSRIEVAPGQVIVRRGGEGHDKEVRVEVVRIARGDGPALVPHSIFTMPALPRGKGETTCRRVNVKREEPAADLFKVPADYKGVERR